MTLRKSSAMTVAPAGDGGSASASSTACGKARSGPAVILGLRGNARPPSRWAMAELVQQVDSAPRITAAAQHLRARALESELSPSDVIGILERWGESLRGASVDAIPGVAFLRLWLRHGTLESIVVRELGAEGLRGEWRQEHGARLRAFPLGIVGHWPAGNIEIQPLLSMSCALLGGNACLVRVPGGLLSQTRALIAKLQEVAGAEPLLQRISMVSFEHERVDLQRAMA